MLVPYVEMKNMKSHPNVNANKQENFSVFNGHARGMDPMISLHVCMQMMDATWSTSI